MRLFNAALQIFSIHFGQTIAESTAFIDYKLLYSGAYEILTTFLTDSSGTGTENLDYLMNHGCWCAKLDPMNAYQELGGPDPVDELDKTCKLWVQMRLCCRLYGGSCYLQQSNVSYSIEYENTILDSSCAANNHSICLEDACEIDKYFVSEIQTQMNDPDWAPELVDTCNVSTGPKFDEKYCVGDIQ